MTTECSGCADLDHRLLVQRRGRAGLHAGAAGHAFGRQESSRSCPAETRLSKPRPSMVSAKVPCTSSQARTQREQTMHLRRIEGEIGVGLVLRPGVEVVRRPHSRSAPRAGRRRRPCPAARSRRWRAGQAVERVVGDVELHHALAQLLAAAAVWVCTTMPAATGVVQEAGVPARPSISTRHSRHEPNASRMSVAHSFGICVPDLHRGAHDRGALGHA